MVKITMLEFIEIHASFEDEPRRIVDPRSIWCDTFAEAAQAIERCLNAGCMIIVNKILVKPDEVENDETSDLDDWPTRHIVDQERTDKGWECARKK